MTAVEIAEVLSLALSTVSLWLKRLGLGKRSQLEPPEPPNRYERRHPGELVHVDIKQLGRIRTRRRAPQGRTPQEPASRLAHQRQAPPTSALRIPAPDDRRAHQTRLRRDPADTHRELRDRVPAPRRRLLRRPRRSDPSGDSDNGSAYIAHAYAQALAQLDLRHLRIKPYRPRTNAKAEGLIQTLLNQWAYERIYGSSAERTTALPRYLHRYNYNRPHRSLSHQPPASRLTNLARNNS